MTKGKIIIWVLLVIVALVALVFPIEKIIIWVLFGIVALVAIVFIYGTIENRIMHYKQMRVFLNTFSDKSFALPTIVFGDRYGWPTFKIIFDSLTSYQKAEEQGLLTKFEKGIGDVCGPKFDPTLAITYIYSDKNST